MIVPIGTIFQTVAILQSLRELMVENDIQAYIIPSEDEHYTEFVAECHHRRAFVSGFTGSAGSVIVGLEHALLWTDGRYYFQAEKELDSTVWELMKDGTIGVPTQAQWLSSNLSPNARVGVDPSLYTSGAWANMESQLVAGNITLVAIEENLVDLIWPNKPPCGSNAIFNLGLEYSGKTTTDKVADVRREMVENNADTLLITELDEVAWLLNLRGSDIPTSSLFFGFVSLTATQLEFYVNRTQFNEDVEPTLTQNVPEIQIHAYENVYDDFSSIVNNGDGMVWVSKVANYKLTRSVPNEKLLLKLTPVSLMKAIKNEVEVVGYRMALVRDAAALCEFWAWLEQAIEWGNITEIGAADKLYQIRQTRSDKFFDNSFTTISATGENAAVIHYMPTAETDTLLSKDEIYLLDSGGLYFDGTTDITRSYAFNEPTDFQKEAYTRVLKGQINLATAKFPVKTVGHRLDSFARQALWSVGLEYLHGTGHGIGSFLNVHEGPFGIGSGNRADDPGLQENMFTSNEPGYYDEEKKFGIRLENIIRVEAANLTNNFQGRGFLQFEDLTFVPYQHKLIDFSLLTDDDIAYLNEYQNKTREIVGTYLLENNFPPEAHSWMMKETELIVDQITSNPTQASSTFVTESRTTSNDALTTPNDNGDSGSMSISGLGKWKIALAMISVVIIQIV